MQRESCIEKLRQKGELSQLDTQFVEKVRQLHQRDQKITELQSLLAELHMKEMQETNQSMQENQQCLEWENDPLHDMLVHNLSNLLKEREEQGMGLHLASQEKNEELNKLKQALVEKQELILQLSAKQQEYHEKEAEQSEAMDQLQKENDDLRSQNEHLGTLLNSKETQIDALKKDQQNLRILLESKNPFENIINQNQQSQTERQLLVQQSQALRQLLALEVNDQVQSLKKTINNYEWKLFCLETELDLSNKEKKQYKYVNDKSEQRLNEYENQIKDQVMKIYSMEQELKRAFDENKILKMDLCNKKNAIEALQCQIESMNEEQNWEQLKELKYRVKEKDEELQEITNYLKEKITQCHEYKVKASSAQRQCSQLNQKIQTIEEQNYQLEQAMIETEDELEVLKDKLEQSSKESDFLNNKINQMSLMFSLRTRQLEEALKQFEQNLKEKILKISELTIELTQKSEQSSKKQDEIAEIQADLEDSKKKQIRLQEDKQQVNQQCKYLRMLLTTKEKEAQKLIKKNDSSQKQIKQKEKIIQMIQIQMKNSRTDLKEMRLSNRRCLQQLEQLRQVVRVSDEKIRILKRQSMQNIQKEMRFVFEMQQLQKSLQLLSQQKQAKQLQLAEKIATTENLSKHIKSIETTTLSRIQQIQQWLKNPSRGYEETTTFEILDEEESFEVMQSQAERDRKQIAKMILEFNSQLKELFQKCQ